MWIEGQHPTYIIDAIMGEAESPYDLAGVPSEVTQQELAKMRQIRQDKPAGTLEGWPEVIKKELKSRGTYSRISC